MRTADDANYFHRRPLFLAAAAIENYTLAEGLVRAAKKFAGECFVHEYDWGRIFRIALVDIAAEQKWNAHGAKIIRQHD